MTLAWNVNFFMVLLFISLLFSGVPGSSLLVKRKPEKLLHLKVKVPFLLWKSMSIFLLKHDVNIFFKHYNWLKWFLKISILSSPLYNSMQYELRSVTSVVPLKWMKWLSCDVYLQGEDHIRCSAVSPCGEWIAYSTTSSLRLYRLHHDNNNVSITKVL